MTTSRWPVLTSLLVALAVGTVGCTGAPSRPMPSSGSLTLAAFTSCDDALRGLRDAARANVGAYGLPGSQPEFGGFARSGAPMAAGAADSAAPSTAPAYSGTNDHEIGVDEPDLVKTDGRRIVTVTGGVLRVADVATRAITGELNLAGQPGGFSAANLLLDGDHALVLTDGGGYSTPNGYGPDRSAPTGPRLLLVDLTATPELIGSYAIDGALVDARQTGNTARVVVRSSPRINFPSAYGSAAGGAGAAGASAQLTANRAVIAHSSLSDWLPRIQVTDHGVTRPVSVPCSAVRRPASYSGGSLLTVLTFDLASDTLGSGMPVSIVGDGDTVYATPRSLYIASDRRWQLSAVGPMVGGAVGIAGDSAPTSASSSGSNGSSRPREETTVYRFDTSGSGAPTFVAAGRVPGFLVNQYAMSEWNNVLRVATTTGTSWAIADGRPADATTSESAVYTLSTSGAVMRTIGSVGGLGVEERIYAVRFIGPTAYVVTFRQTDPLYTVDLSDPARPQVRGALQLTGYSAYLHPASDTRLIGIGQQADAVGHVGGMQVSLFDVSDLSTPTRVATIAVRAGESAAEFDPHAFLYWPADGLVVVPLQARSGSDPAGVLVLHATDSTLVELGVLSQPANTTGYGYAPPISRSLVIGQTLWTVSDAGLMANNLTDLTEAAWLPFG